MSNQVYPTLPGSLIEVERTSVYATSVQRESSGRELRVSTQAPARYRYKIRYDFLRQDGPIDEAATLAAFAARHRGAWDSFLFTDPYSSAASATPFGTGDGSTTVFYLRDEMFDLIGAPNGPPSIYVAGVLQVVTTNYTLDSMVGKVTFVTAPANAAALTWSGAFYRRVRFYSDDLGLRRRVARVWKADVELISVL